MYKFKRYYQLGFSDLLNKARDNMEGIIDDLCRRFDHYTPRMYRQNTRKDYLNLAKCKKRTKKRSRKTIKQHEFMLVFIQNNASKSLACC